MKANETVSDRIVLVEDDPSISELLDLYLTREGYQVVATDSGARGAELARDARPALVILDLMLPDRSGFDVLKSIRQSSQVPVVILTARDAEHDKIHGLELGADDYVTKPFSPGELVARVRAILRRTRSQAEPPAQVLGGVQLFVGERTVSIDGRLVDLTPKEFELLHYLLVNRGLALSRERLLEEVWGYAFLGDARTVDVHVGQLRKKLGRWGRLIQTVWGFGYRAADTPDGPAGDEADEAVEHAPDPAAEPGPDPAVSPAVGRAVRPATELATAPATDPAAGPAADRAADAAPAADPAGGGPDKDESAGSGAHAPAAAPARGGGSEEH